MHILVVAFSVLFALFLYVRFLEARSLFIPYRNIDQTPEALGFSFQDLKIFETRGIVLNAWYIPGLPGKDTLLFLHGNGGNISHRLSKIAFFHSLGINILIFDYRGYGLSTGSPSEQGLYQDATASYRYLTESLGIPGERIILYGESLGAAVALELATKVRVKGLILEGAFTSVPDMSRHVFFFIPGFFIKNKFDSFSKIDKTEAPKLFIHSRNDEIVPFSMGQRLFEKAKEPKAFLEIHGGHNDVSFLTDPTVARKISDFIVR